MNMNIAELVASIEVELQASVNRETRSREQIEAILARVTAEGRSHLSDAENRECERLDGLAVKEREDQAGIKVKLARAKAAEAEELAQEARLNVVTPTAAAARAGGNGSYRVGDNPSSLYGVPTATAGPQWRGISASPDGRMPNGDYNAVLGRDEAWSDHPVNRAYAASRAEQDRIVTGTHGSFQQQIRSMSTSGASAIVPTIWSDQIIQKVRNKAVTLRAGVSVVPMPSKIYQIGRLNTDPTASFKTEGSTITASDLAYDYIQLQASTLTALTVFSSEFLADAIDGDGTIIDAISAVMALEIDKTVLYGGFLTADGVTGEGYNLASPYPTNGVFKNLLTNSVANVLNNGTTNGTVQTSTSWFRELQSLYFSIKKRNETPGAMIMNDGMLQRYVDAYDTQGRVLGLPPNIPLESILTTNVIPNVTKGTGTLMSNVFCADWSQVLLGQRQELEVRVLSERYAENNQVAVVSTWRGDINLARLSAAGIYRYLQGS